MIVLDTNIVSELIRPRPNPSVVDWVARQPGTSLFISAVTEAELRYGVEILPAGHRRERLAAEIESTLREDFSRRILPFDSAAARAYAVISGGPPRYAGRPISQADCQIAAIARSRGVPVATRRRSRLCRLWDQGSESLGKIRQRGVYWPLTR